MSKQPPNPPLDGKFVDPLDGVSDEGLSMSPETSSMAVQLSEKFQYQSFLDDALLEQAILVQPPNTSIIFPDSKKATKALSGYGISVAPFSDVPLAVKAQSGGAKGSSAYLIPPGTTWRPHGIYPGQKRNAFSGIQVGLPAGFLGGGRATFALLTSPDAEVKWADGSIREILVQRQRYVLLSTANPLPAISKTKGQWVNWPTGFPAANVLNQTGRPQQGQASGRFVGTRIEVRARFATAGGERLFAIMRGTDDMDTGVDGETVSQVDESYVEDIVFDASAIAGAFDVQEVVGGPLCREGGDFCRVDFVTAPGDLVGAKIDIFRYAILG